MEKYQIRVLGSTSYLFGGKSIDISGGDFNSLLIIRNDEFGEPISISLVRRPITQPEEHIDIGILQPSEVFAVDLKNTVRVEAKCTEAFVDSLVYCTIATKLTQ